MSTHLARARLLLAQSRPADAEREAEMALAAQPDDSAALAVLALSRSDQNKADGALEAARMAVGLAPDQAHLHYVHAVVLHRHDREAEARPAIAEAIRLDPEDADNFSVLAAIELTRRDWPAALVAAEQALALNPEHLPAANRRSMALVRMGRKAEAMEGVAFALRRAPENAFSHANQGWNCLHGNDPRRAQEHFREALRLQPDLEYARQGMLEALKARNPVYRVMLAYFLWMGRQGRRFQVIMIVSLWFGFQAIGELAEDVSPFFWLLLLLFCVFIYLSWTAVPMFNLLLRLDRFGRHVLSRDQRMGSNFFGLMVAGFVGCLAWWATGGGIPAANNAIYCAVLSICVAITFNREGRQRWMFGSLTAGLAVIASVIASHISEPWPDGPTWRMAFTVGFIGIQLLANFKRG